MIKNAIRALVIILIMSACGGDGSSDNSTPSEEANDTNTTQEVLVIDGYTLPPDPGEAGKATIMGIDSNNNGVRDDVERAIYLTYKRPVERAFIMQDAKSFEMVMANPVEAATSEEYRKLSFRNSACEGYLRRNFNVNSDTGYKKPEIQFLLDEYMNTKERIKARIDWNIASSGGSYGVPGISDYNAESCDFNITELIESE